MRNDLHRAAEEISSPFLGDDVLVDPARGDVVFLVGVAAGETLIVTKVEVCFRAVVGDEHLAVLVGAHGAGVDVEIGVELPEPHLVATGLQQCA